MIFPQFKPPSIDSLHKIVNFTNENRLEIQVELNGLNFRLGQLKKVETLAEVKMKLNSALSPVFEYKKKDRAGKLYVGVSGEGGERISRVLSNVRDECNLALSSKLPLCLDLTINSGGSNIDGSGLKLKEINLSTTGKTTLCCKTPNLVKCNNLYVLTRGAIFKGEWLGNINFDVFHFNGRVGLYTLDFRGKFSGTRSVEIIVGVAILKLILPNDTGIRLKPNIWLKSINGLRAVDEGWWESPNFGTLNKKLIIHVDGSFAILEVEVI